MMGIMKQLCESMRLDELQNELRPAYMRNEKKCVKCGFCCNMRTCVPTPNEVEKIAEFLKMETDKMINKYFAIDMNPRIGYDVHFIKPVGLNIQDLAGKSIPASRTFNEGPCIFLDEENRCKIYKVVPKSAKMTKCWESNNGNEINEFIRESWKGNKLGKMFNLRFKRCDDDII